MSEKSPAQPEDGRGWTDFSQEFSGDMPHPPSIPAPEFETLRDVATDDINVQRYAVATHVGTHVDAPIHFVEGGATIDDLPLERFAGDAIILDVSVDEPEAITVDRVTAAEGTVQQGDIVLLHTGWGEKFGSEAYASHPWLSVELADWFVERGVSFVGMDVLTPDIPGPRRPDGWTEFPVHRTLLGEGILIAENLTNLGPYTGQRVPIQGFPINIRGGDGAPARFVGRTERD